ncbi:MAG: hypothetical protein LBF60_00335 [Treponema sp.]|jgi:hypothetical protein|nr:hypothetical protein [Treponema sp.]
MTAAIRAVEDCRFAAPVITNAIRMARWLRHSKDRIIQAAFRSRLYYEPVPKREPAFWNSLLYQSSLNALGFEKKACIKEK